MSHSFVHQAVARPDTAPATASTPLSDDGPRTWGLVTIEVIDFTPSGLKSRPPSITDGIAGHQVSQIFAIAFNRSDFARNKRRWALVNDVGTVVMLNSITDDERPLAPNAFPPFVKSGLTMHEAVNQANELNAPRLKLARVPRQWSIPVRPISEKGDWA